MHARLRTENRSSAKPPDAGASKAQSAGRRCGRAEYVGRIGHNVVNLDDAERTGDVEDEAQRRPWSADARPIANETNWSPFMRHLRAKLAILPLALALALALSGGAGVGMAAGEEIDNPDPTVQEDIDQQVKVGKPSPKLSL
jgi:hypothetical protein